MKQVLILGAGLVSRPIIRYFLTRTEHRVVVASQNVERGRELVADHPRGRALSLAVEDTAALEALIAEADVVVSLLPAAHHARVAGLAIPHRVPVVTTSYVSPEMRELDAAARREGVLLLNEIGLDPGLDHMSAMRTIDRVRREGGTVTEFSSCCGGLPAPEAAVNPWGYKFSWSARGVFLAGRLPARYLCDGRVVEVKGEELFSHRWEREVEGQGRFEVYPNRDALGYMATYGIEGVRGMFRGTLRYPGWCETLAAIAELGLLSVEERDWAPGTTYAELLSSILAPGPGSLAERLAARLGLPPGHDVVRRLEWAGLLSPLPLPGARASPLDLLSTRLERVMSYAPGERDMVVLRDEVLVQGPGPATERLVSVLVAFGDGNGDSAMSRTVSLPAAVATRLLLEKKLESSGVEIPVHSEIYEPVMAELEEMGIRFEVRREPLGARAG